MMDDQQAVALLPVDVLFKKIPPTSQICTISKNRMERRWFHRLNDMKRSEQRKMK